MRWIALVFLALMFAPYVAPGNPSTHFIPQDWQKLSNMPDGATVTIIVLGHVDSKYTVKYLPHLDFTILRGPKVALLSEISKTPYMASLDHTYHLDSLVTNLGEGIPMPLAPYGRNQEVNGSGVTVAVIDTGVDGSHPMINGSIVGRYDAWGEFSKPTDVMGHGTLVASVIAGKPVSGDVHFSDYGTAPDPGYAYPFYLYIPEPTNVSIRLTRDNSSPGYDMLIQVKLANGVVFTVDQSTDTEHVETRNGPVPQGPLYILVGTSQSSTNSSFPWYLGVSFHTDIPVGGGIAPGAKIYGVKVFSSTQETTDTEHILYGIDHVISVAKQYNITVANLSLGSDTSDPALDQAMDALVDNGILPVVAAGNSGPNYNTIGSPAEAPAALTVGAATMYGSVAYYSSRGVPTETEIDKIKPDVLGVGGGMFVGGRIEGPDTNAPDINGVDFYPNDLYAAIGTSFASPAVAGIAALIYSAIPNADPYFVKYLITTGTFETANITPKDAPPNQEAPNQPSLDRVGKDAVEGRGMTYLPAIMNAVLNEYQYGNMPNITMYFGGDIGMPKVASYVVDVAPGSNVTFSILGNPKVDVDLLVYSLDQTQIDNNLGNPIIVAASTSPTSWESVSFIANATKYLVVIRRVSGEGNVTLTYKAIEDNEPPQINKIKAFMIYNYLSLSVLVSDNLGVTSVYLKDSQGKTYYLKPQSSEERTFSGFVSDYKLEGTVYARDVGGNVVSQPVSANGLVGLVIVLAFSVVMLGLAVLLIKKAGE